MLFGFEVTNTFILVKDIVPLLMEHIQSKIVKDKVLVIVGGRLVGDRPARAAGPCREDLPGGGHRQP